MRPKLQVDTFLDGSRYQLRYQKTSFIPFMVVSSELYFQLWEKLCYEANCPYFKRYQQFYIQWQFVVIRFINQIKDLRSIKDYHAILIEKYSISLMKFCFNDVNSYCK